MPHILKSDDFKNYRMVHSIASSVGIGYNKSLNVVVHNDKLSYEVVSHAKVIATADNLSEIVAAYNEVQRSLPTNL